MDEGSIEDAASGWIDIEAVGKELVAEAPRLRDAEDNGAVEMTGERIGGFVRGLVLVLEKGDDVAQSGEPESGDRGSRAV